MQPSHQTRRLFLVLESYLAINLPAFQALLAATLPSSISRVLAGFSARLPGKVLLVPDILRPQLRYSLANQILNGNSSATEGEKAEFETYEMFLSFLGEVYNRGWNCELLRTLDREIVARFLVPVIQPRILSLDLAVARTALQYLVFALESANSAKFAACVRRFVFSRSQAKNESYSAASGEARGMDISFSSFCDGPLCGLQPHDGPGDEECIEHYVNVGKQQGEELSRQLEEGGRRANTGGNKHLPREVTRLVIKCINIKKEGCSAIALQLINKLLEQDLGETASTLLPQSAHRRLGRDSSAFEGSAEFYRTLHQCCDFGAVEPSLSGYDGRLIIAEDQENCSPNVVAPGGGKRLVREVHARSPRKRLSAVPEFGETISTDMMQKAGTPMRIGVGKKAVTENAV